MNFKVFACFVSFKSIFSLEIQNFFHAGNIENGAAHSNFGTPFTMLRSPPIVLMSLQKVEQYSMADTFEGVH